MSLRFQTRPDHMCDCPLPSPFLYDQTTCELCHGSTVFPLPKTKLTSSHSGNLPSLEDSQYDPLSMAKVLSYISGKPQPHASKKLSKKDSWSSESSSLRPSTQDKHSRSYSNISTVHVLGQRGHLNRTESQALIKGKNRSPYSTILTFNELLSNGKLEEEDNQDEDVKPRKPHDSAVHLGGTLDTRDTSRASTNTNFSHSHEASQSPTFSALKDAMKRHGLSSSVTKGTSLRTRTANISDSYPDGKVLFQGIGHRNAVNAVIANEDWTVSGSSDYCVNVWKTKQFRSGESQLPLVSTTTAHKRAVHCLCWVDEKLFCSGAGDKTIKVISTQFWNIENGHPAFQFSLQKHVSPVQQLLSPSPKLLVSGSSDGVLLLWDTESHAVISEDYMEHTRAITGLTQQSPSTFLSSSYDGSIKLWDLRNKRSIASFQGHSGPVHAVRLWDEHSFYSSGDDFTIRKWDFRTCAVLQTLQTLEEVRTICRVKNRLVTGGRSIKVWETDTELELPRGSVRTMTLVQRSDLLVAGTSESCLLVGVMQVCKL